MRDSLAILELDAIKAHLCEYATLSFTKNKINNLTYSTDSVHIQEELDKTNEALHIVASFGRCPIEYIHDIEQSIEKASKLGVLTIEELYHIGSQANGIIRMQSFKKSIEGDYPNFEYYVNSLIPLKELQARIDNCISPNFEIYDKASTTLSRIRKDIINKESEVRKVLDRIVKDKSNYLSDNIITMRNDRLVVPVKAAYKNSLDGIIHDESQTKGTSYIEPEEAVILNSQLQALKQQEFQEIERILRELTRLVAVDADTLLNNQKIIEEIDYMFAKGAYGASIDGICSELSNEQVIELKGARHPLIDKKIAVANDFYLGGTNNNIYLITGPNTGGKTVALKTVGIIALMNQLGLAVPCNFSSKLGIFESFYADIGDEQSIEQSLSTFSSHLTKLTDMVKNVTSKSLILVDEIGGGTDPSEGEAIAMSTLNHFHNKGAIVLASTHYQNLKTFAIEQGYISNCSMLFDKDNLKPTYKLNVGVSGKSYALEIAKNLGYPESLIEKAKEYKEHFQTEASIKLENLEKEIEKNQAKEIELEKLKEAANIEIIKANKIRLDLERQEEKVKEKAQEEIDKLVSDAKEKVSSIFDTLKNENIKLHEVIKAKKDIEELERVDEEEVSFETGFKVGDYVKVISTNKIGKITEIRGSDYLVNMSGLTLKVKETALEHTAFKEEEPKKSKLTVELIHVSPELNIIGLHVDEAYDAVDKYIDSAIRVHLKTVRIIHGFGSGALRNMVQKYLKSCKYVKSFHFGGAYDGGMGATIVDFKE